MWLQAPKADAMRGRGKQGGREGGSSTRSKILSLEGGRGRFGPNWKDLLEMWQ